MTPDTPPDSGSRTALVIGGTGMLRPACLSLVSLGWRVHAIGRTPHDDLAAPGLAVHRADWHDRSHYLGLLAEIRRAIGTGGTVVAWLHSDAAVSHEDVAMALTPSDYLEVHGSASMVRASQLAAEPGTGRRRVVLGEVREGSSRRWLTHAEISRGVVAALLSDRELSVVGQLPV